MPEPASRQGLLALVLPCPGQVYFADSQLPLVRDSGLFDSFPILSSFPGL